MTKNAKITAAAAAAVEIATTPVEIATTPVEIATTPVEVKMKKTFRFYKAGKDIDLSVKLPPQATAILKFMKETNFRGTGPQIIKAMIEKGLITTRQEPAVLFAFYARKLESVGLIRE